VILSNLALPNRICSDAYIDGSSDGIDINGRLRGARDRDVPRGAENRLDLHHRASNAHSVEQITRPWHSDGGKYGQNAERNGQLDDGERLSHRRASFRRVGWLDSIRYMRSTQLLRITWMYSIGPSLK